MLEAIPAGFSGKIYDLGSGWGTLAISVSREFPGATIDGFENSIIPYLISELSLRILRIPNVAFHFKNFHKIGFQDADLILCYLYPGGMASLKPKLASELKPGTWIITNTFAISGWTPEQTRRTCDLYKSPVYVYKVGTPFEEMHKEDL